MESQTALPASGAHGQRAGTPPARGATASNSVRARAHLTAAALALAIIGALVLAGWAYCVSVENQYLEALAPTIFMQKTLGNALQREAAARPDLLPVYGSSELRTGGKYNAGAFFKNFPTGFAAFNVGLHGDGSLTTTLELAALGSSLRGKKVAIFLSPYFFRQPMVPPEWYAFSFSDLNASEFVFSPDLSWNLKRTVARRMLQYPQTLDDPLLQFGLERLADPSSTSSLLYWAAYPLGQLHIAVLRLQDHFELLTYIREHPELSASVARAPSAPNWKALAKQAARETQATSTNNVFGVDNSYWNSNHAQIEKQQDDLDDETFTQLWQHSAEWSDLAAVLQELKQLGAQPLLLTIPMHGSYWDYRGVSKQARAQFYDHFRQVGAEYGVPTVTLEDHEYDTFFFQDVEDHPSKLGWVYFDQALDAFYHGQLQ